MGGGISPNIHYPKYDVAAYYQHPDGEIVAIESENFFKGSQSSYPRQVPEETEAMQQEEADKRKQFPWRYE